MIFRVINRQINGLVIQQDRSYERRSFTLLHAQERKKGASAAIGMNYWCLVGTRGGSSKMNGAPYTLGRTLLFWMFIHAHLSGGNGKVGHCKSIFMYRIHTFTSASFHFLDMQETLYIYLHFVCFCAPLPITNALTRKRVIKQIAKTGNNAVVVLRHRGGNKQQHSRTCFWNRLKQD